MTPSVRAFKPPPQHEVSQLPLVPKELFTPGNTVIKQEQLPTKLLQLPEASFSQPPVDYEKRPLHLTNEEVTWESPIKFWYTAKENKKFSLLFSSFKKKYCEEILTQRFSGIPELSPSFIETLNNKATFTPNIIQGLNLADCFYTLAKLEDQEFWTLFVPQIPASKTDFNEIIAQLDPFYIFNISQSLALFRNRKPVKRNKRAYIDIFREKLSNNRIFLPSSHEVDNLEELQWQSFVNTSITQWKSTYTSAQHQRNFSAESLACLKRFNEAIRTPGLHTQKWDRPPGVNKILLNHLVETFYNFKCGSHIFPINYIQGVHKDFFTRTTLPDAMILNPPYRIQILERVVTHLVRICALQRKCFAILVPVRPDESWYKLCLELQFPILKLSSKLCFRRGIQSQWVGQAQFESALILIGATIKGPQLIDVQCDKFGYPLNFGYVKEFSRISFPENLLSGYPVVKKEGASQRLEILGNIMLRASAADKVCFNNLQTPQFEMEKQIALNFLFQKSKAKQFGF